MNALVEVLVGYAALLALILGVIYVPLVAGVVASTGLASAACVELAHGRIANAVTSFVYGVAFWLLAVMAAQHAPSKRRASP